MTDRRVRKSGKDTAGDITKLCSDGEFWSPVSKATAISDIESGMNRYYVEEVAPRVYVTVYSAAGKKRLRTTADSTSKNNLDKLPNC